MKYLIFIMSFGPSREKEVDCVWPAHGGVLLSQVKFPRPFICGNQGSPFTPLLVSFFKKGESSLKERREWVGRANQGSVAHHMSITYFYFTYRKTGQRGGTTYLKAHCYKAVELVLECRSIYLKCVLLSNSQSHFLQGYASVCLTFPKASFSHELKKI